MNKLTHEKRCAVVRALVEGCSIRSTVRMTGVSKNTITKLLVHLGNACSEYQAKVFQNLPCKRLQLDEIWSFVGAKEKNVPADRRGEFGIGDVWTWTAICADTKLIPTWLVGARNGECATQFVGDLAGRLANRVQITTDGLKCYLDAVDEAFGSNVDYSMLIKTYGNAPGNETRYSPAVCTGCMTEVKMGNPDQEHVSTSYVERANLTMRMSMRRFTRLTNAFSKKWTNHEAMFALFAAWYNFCRKHQTVKTTPAVAAGIAAEPWTLERLLTESAKTTAA